VASIAEHIATISRANVLQQIVARMLPNGAPANIQPVIVDDAIAIREILTAAGSPQNHKRVGSYVRSVVDSAAQYVLRLHGVNTDATWQPSPHLTENGTFCH